MWLHHKNLNSITGERVMMKFMSKRLCALGLAGSLIFGVTLSTGCFGTFPFARTVWDINKDVSSNKYVQWLVFLGLTVIPVYGAAVVVDLFVGNSLEFWSGEPMMTEDGETPVEKKVVELSDDRKAVMTRLGKRHVHVRIVEDGQPDREFILDGRGDSLVVRDGDGGFLGAASEADDGGVLVTDEEGQVIEHHDANSVEQLEEDLERDGVRGAKHFAAEYRRAQGPMEATMVRSWF